MTFPHDSYETDPMVALIGHRRQAVPLKSKWCGDTWTAEMTTEPYGIHLAVAALDRAPTDVEVGAAITAGPPGAWAADLTDVTQWWRCSGQVCPWVRHFVPRAQAKRLLDLTP